MKCTVKNCNATLRSQEDLKRHMRLIHGWMVFFFVLTLLALGGCTDIARRVGGPDTKGDTSTEPWLYPQSKPVPTKEYCEAHQQFCDIVDPTWRLR